MKELCADARTQVADPQSITSKTPYFRLFFFVYSPFLVQIDKGCNSSDGFLQTSLVAVVQHRGHGHSSANFPGEN